MTVDDLAQQLLDLSNQGLGNLPVKSWDPDSEEGGYFPITGLLILDSEIQLCVDEV